MGRSYLALALLAALLGPVAVALAGPADATGGPVVVFAAPWADAPAIAARAGGRLIGPEQSRVGALAYSADPDFVSRLKAEGAWFVIGNSRLLALCGAGA